MLCLQQEEKISCFMNPECFFVKRGFFRLPFVEPEDYLILIQEKTERKGFLEVLKKFKGDPKSLKELLRILSKLLYELLLNGFVFHHLNFEDFVVFKGKMGVRLSRPNNLIFWEGGFEDLELVFLEECKELWNSFEILAKQLKINRNKANFNYFLLVHAFYNFRKNQSEIEETDFEVFFKENFHASQPDSVEAFLFSLFTDKIPSIPFDTLSIFLQNEILDLRVTESPQFLIESPQMVETHQLISTSSFFPAQKQSHVQLNSHLAFLDFLILMLKFDEAHQIIKKLKTIPNLGFPQNWSLLEKTAQIQLQTEEYDKGMETLEKSMGEIQKVMGLSVNSFSGKSAFLLSLFHIQKNRFSDAINLLETSYSGLKKLPKSTTLVQIMFALGHLYRETSQFDKSFKFFSRIQTESLEFWDENSQLARIFCETLGMLYIQRHEFLSAKLLLEKALEIYKLRFSNMEKHEKYANIMNSLGMCYFELKIPEKALQFYEKSIEIKGSLFSQDYEKKGETMMNLALIYFELNDFHQAIEYNQKAIEIYSQSKEKRNLANSLNNLGLAYKSSMDFEKAIVNMKKALSLFESEYGKNDVLCGKTLNNIGMTYYDKGETSEAIEYCEKALEIYKISSQDQQIIARVLNNIGVLYTGNKDYDKAREYYKKAVEIKKSPESKNPVDIADSLSNLANIHHLQKDLETAKELYREILDIRMKYLGESHRSTLETMRNLAESLLELKTYQESSGFFRKLREIKQKTESGFDKSLEKATISSKIACCQANLSRFLESMIEWKVAIGIEKEFGGNKKVLAGYLKEYGLVLRSGERFKEAMECLKEALEVWKKIKEKDEREIKVLKEEIKKTKSLMK